MLSLAHEVGPGTLASALSTLLTHDPATGLLAALPPTPHEPSFPPGTLSSLPLPGGLLSLQVTLWPPTLCLLHHITRENGIVCVTP